MRKLRDRYGNVYILKEQADYSEVGKQILRILGRVIAGWLLLAALVGFASYAFAHSWYPIGCCDDEDCRPLAAEQVELTDDGYLVKYLGVTVPYDAARVSPDGDYHICNLGGDPEANIVMEWFGDDRSDEICFWAPMKGM